MNDVYGHKYAGSGPLAIVDKSTVQNPLKGCGYEGKLLQVRGQLGLGFVIRTRTA